MASNKSKTGKKYATNKKKLYAYLRKNADKHGIKFKDTDGK